MFCPRCGDAMTQAFGTLECTRGRMPLSKQAVDMLTTVIASPRSNLLPSGGTNSPWYCPRCQAPLLALTPASLELGCKECGLVLDRALVHALVERHPHLTDGND